MCVEGKIIYLSHVVTRLIGLDIALIEHSPIRYYGVDLEGPIHTKSVGKPCNAYFLAIFIDKITGGTLNTSNE